MSPSTGLSSQVWTRSTRFLVLVMPTKRCASGSVKDTSVPPGTRLVAALLAAAALRKPIGVSQICSRRSATACGCGTGGSGGGPAAGGVAAAGGPATGCGDVSGAGGPPRPPGGRGGGGTSHASAPLTI